MQIITFNKLCACIIYVIYLYIYTYMSFILYESNKGRTHTVKNRGAMLPIIKILYYYHCFTFSHFRSTKMRKYGLTFGRDNKQRITVAN